MPEGPRVTWNMLGKASVHPDFRHVYSLELLGMWCVLEHGLRFTPAEGIQGIFWVCSQLLVLEAGKGVGRALRSLKRRRKGINHHWEPGKGLPQDPRDLSVTRRTSVGHFVG